MHTDVCQEPCTVHVYDPCQLSVCNRPTPELIDIGFSSNIDIDRTRDEVSNERGVIKLKGAKHSLYNAGLYLLPKYALKPSTFPLATIDNLKSYLFEPRNLIDKMTRGYENNPTTARNALLRDTLKCIWSNVTTNPEVGETTKRCFNCECNVLICFLSQLAHVAYLIEALVRMYIG